MREGWEVKTIGDVCDLMTGGTPSRSKQEYFANGNIKWLVSGDIHKKEIFDCEGRITQEGMENSNAKLLPVNSVLIALNGQGKTRGTVALLRTKATCNQSLVSICPKRNVDLLPEYLFCNLYGRYDEIRKMTGDSGDDRRGLNMPLIRSLDIPVAPLSEQKRIVEILDEAFAAIDKAKANVEKNLQNARELFESYLQSVFENKGEDWEEKRLEQVCSFQNGQAHEKQIDEKGKYILVNSRFVSTNSEDYKRTSSALSPLFVGDIVLVMSDVPNGKTLAKCFIIDKDDTYSLNQRICVIRSNVFNERFLFYQLNRHKHLLAFNNGENQTNLRKDDILKTPLLITSMKVQNFVVEHLDAFSEETKKLQIIYQQKLNDLEELKKSILQKAFSGELTNELSEKEELQLLFMCLNIFMHDGKKQLATLAEVKMEKMCHFAESRIPELTFNRVPVKEEYGPADFKRLYKLHNYAEAHDIFTYERGADYEKYPKGENFMKWVRKALQQLAPTVKKQVTVLIDLLKPLKTRQIDVRAITYAAWNNLLIRGVDDSFDNIRTEALWHARKFEFTDEDFREAIDFLKANHLVPEGKGKLVLDKTA